MQDAVDPGRQSGLQRAGRSRLRPQTGEGPDHDPSRPVPRRDVAAQCGGTCRRPISWKRGATRDADDRDHRSLCQPLIEPLYGGKSAIEMLALVLGDKRPDETTGAADVQAAFGRKPIRRQSGGEALPRRSGIARSPIDIGKLAFRRRSRVSEPITARNPATPDNRQRQLEIIFCPTPRSTTGGSPTTAGCRKCPTP